MGKVIIVSLVSILLVINILFTVNGLKKVWEMSRSIPLVNQMLLGAVTIKK